MSLADWTGPLAYLSVFLAGATQYGVGCSTVSPGA